MTGHILILLATIAAMVWGGVMLAAGGMSDNISEGETAGKQGFYLCVGGAIGFLANLAFWIF